MVNFINLSGGDPLCTLHRTKGLYSVHLGCTQGVYERFPIVKLIRYTPESSYTRRTVQGRAAPSVSMGSATLHVPYICLLYCLGGGRRRCQLPPWSRCAGPAPPYPSMTSSDWPPCLASQPKLKS